MAQLSHKNFLTSDVFCLTFFFNKSPEVLKKIDRYT